MAVLDRGLDLDVVRDGGSRSGVISRLRRHPAPVVGLLVALVSYAGAGVPSYWGDEAASVLSAQRSWDSLLAELSTVDAVHGVYYAVLHVWIQLFGAGEWATRLLSTIGIGLLAAAVVVLGRRWFDVRTGVLAGLIVAVIPRASVLAIEARGYAVAAAAAAWLTVLVVALIDGQASRGMWAVYGIAVAAAGTFFLYLLLMPAVHLAVILTMVPATRRGRTLRRWGGAMTIAAVLALPILVLSQQQKGQIAFLAHRGYMSPKGWFVSPWFGHLPAAIVLWPVLLVGVAALAIEWRRRRWPGAAPATLVWLILPGVLLAVVDALLSPAYNPRYLSFCLGAVALVLAIGCIAVVDAARRVDLRRGGAIAIVVLVLLGMASVVPEFLRARGEFAKDGGADGRAVAAEVETRAEPGDTVLFGTGTRPSRAPRLVYRLYPEAFGELNDPQLRRSAADTDGLWDVLAPVSEVASALPDGRVWLIETGSTGTAEEDLAALEEHGFVHVARTVVHRTVVYEFQRGSGS